MTDEYESCCCLENCSQPCNCFEVRDVGQVERLSNDEVKDTVSTIGMLHSLISHCCFVHDGDN